MHAESHHEGWPEDLEDTEEVTLGLNYRRCLDGDPGSPGVLAGRGAVGRNAGFQRTQQLL